MKLRQGRFAQPSLAKAKSSSPDFYLLEPHSSIQFDGIDKLQRGILDALQALGRKRSAQVALAWMRYRKVPVIPIIGARKMAQFEDNMASLTLQLTPGQLAGLDSATAVELGFPHEFFNMEMPRTLAFGGMRDRIFT